MSDEIALKADKAQDGDGVAKNEIDTETKEPKEGKQRSVSFNRDVHVKRFGKPRERGTSSEHQPPTKLRKEPFTNLSEKQLIEEANKVIAQAQSITCTADHPPEKFFSLPHRKKFKEDKTVRRNSDDEDIPEEIIKQPLGRSTSDVSQKRKKERTSLSTLFRRGQKNKAPDAPVAVNTKPLVVVKRSKSDVTDLKSNTNLNKTKPIRKRSGSETEEFLKSLRNKKSQLSPIIESSPREDYFKKVSPLDVFQKQKIEKEREGHKSDDQTSVDSKKVNPIEKPPRYNKTPENQDPKPPSRTKRGKSLEKEQSPPIFDTPKRKTDIKKTFLVDEIDSKTKESAIEIKDRIKDSIIKLEENVYGDKEMIHSSQQPPDKPPLTRGNTVGQIVRILKEDQNSPPPKSHLISPSNASNNNQPFSYTKPSTSPDPNLFVRTTSPDRVPTPVNKMNGKGVVYAQVIKDNHDSRTHFTKQTMHDTYLPSKERYGNFSDEDEGLGYEERQKNIVDRLFDNDYKNNNNSKFHTDSYNIKESPIRPRFREYKLTSFENFEPTYANEYDDKISPRNPIDSYRGRADGMDTKRKVIEPSNKIDLNFNDLSHRRELLESRLNARRFEREKINLNEPISKYLAENDPIYEAEKRMKQTEKYVNDTVKYYRHTLERDGFESTITEDYKYDSDNHKQKYHTETRKTHKLPRDDMIRRKVVNELGRECYKEKNKKVIPPEPEYEPPSLEFNHSKPISSPDEYIEKKYKAKKIFTNSNDHLQTGQKYKVKDNLFGKRKGHYASNPEIAQEREDDYANLRYNTKHESYHNSLRRVKNKEKEFKNHSIRRHDSGDSRDYYREQSSPRRFDFDNRLVDSGIENDFRLNSSGEIPRSRHRRNESDDARDSSLFLVNERQHTEDNYASEQIYSNENHLASYKEYENDNRKSNIPRGRSTDDGSILNSKKERYDKSSSRQEVSAKPPKAAKKLSGLEKMKQLFSRDSSKKSKKEKDVVQPKTRTRVLKSPEHLAVDDSEYRRYTDPEPSDIEVKRRDPKEDRRKYPREDADRYRSSDSRESIEKRRGDKYKDSDFDGRFERTVKEDKRYKEHREDKRRYNSSDIDSDHHRLSEAESERRRTRSNTAAPIDSPTLAQRYRERRRLATPSPTPSPPPRQPTTQNSWFKSLDRLGKKREKTSKVEKESVITAGDESSRRLWSKPSKPPTPSKNLRFFGDTDQESDTNVKQTVTKTKSHPQPKSRGTLRKTVSNSSNGLDEVDHELPNKSYSLSNLHREEKSVSPKTRAYYKRNLQNISEIQSNSEVESIIERKMATKPPISPYDRSRSHSSSKTLKASKADARRPTRMEDRGSSSELRNSKQDLNRELKHRRRTPVTNSGESSTEGDSSQQSQRSVVYLHATTVGDIPDPGRATRNRSRDDVSSIMSSNLQVRSTTKSFSIFAPWTPRHNNEQYDVHYAQKPKKTKQKESVFKKSSSTKNLTDDRPATLQKNKSYSQTTLSRRPPSQNNRLTNSSTTLYRREKRGKENDISQNTVARKSANGRKSQSSEVLNRDERSKISRSVSIPKEKKAPGWFKLTNKNKKQENTRVR